MRKKSIYRSIAFSLAMALFVFLIGFQILPLSYNESSIIDQTDLQAMRAQRIAKDALILSYRPNGEHAQAISELQNTLPAWERQQAWLQQNVRNPDIQTLLDQAQPDYQALDTAARQLLAHPTDQTQMVIILQHERNYSLLMNQISSLVQERAQAINSDLVIFQVAITVAIIVLVILLMVLSRQPKPVPIKKEETT
jgi:hypothetical protein